MEADQFAVESRSIAGASLEIQSENQMHDLWILIFSLNINLENPSLHTNEEHVKPNQ